LASGLALRIDLARGTTARPRAAEAARSEKKRGRDEYPVSKNQGTHEIMMLDDARVAIYGDLRRRRTFYEGLSQARSWSRGVADEFELARARAAYRR